MAGMNRVPILGLHIAAAVALVLGWTIIILGSFENRFILMLLVPGTLIAGYLFQSEYKRGVRAIDLGRDKYLPIGEKREQAMRILADWRGTAPDEVRAAVDALCDEWISAAGPTEIACMAVRYLDPPE